MHKPVMYSKENERQDWLLHMEKFSLMKDIKDDKEAMSSFVRFLKEITFSQDETIIQEGSNDPRMFFLTSGEVRVSKKTPSGEHYVVAILNSHQYPFFGEGAMLDEDSRGASIVSQTRCECLVLGKQEFEEFSKMFPQYALPIIKRIAQTMMKRLRKLNSDFVTLYRAFVSEVSGEIIEKK